MGYDSWTTGIYTMSDAVFKYWEHQDNISWLEGIIKRELGEEFLFGKDGDYKFKPKDEYEGIKRKQLTENRG